MAEVLTLLERIQRNQDDIIRRLVVSSMQILTMCVCVWPLRGIAARYTAVGDSERRVRMEMK